jgi:hypothetical protein
MNSQFTLTPGEHILEMWGTKMKTTHFVGEVSARVVSLEGGPPEGGNLRVLLNPRKNPWVQEPPPKIRSLRKHKNLHRTSKRTHKYRNLQVCKGLCFMGT